MINIRAIEEEIEKSRAQLAKTERELARLKKNVVPGTKLYAMKKGNTFQYFLRSKGSETHGEYINKENRKIAEVMAQIEYEEELVGALRKAVNDLEQLKLSLESEPYTFAEQKLSEGKRALISRMYSSDEEYVKAWRGENYEMLGFKDTEKEYYTKSGLRVRSKSEIIIAEMLDEEGIPYCYEKPIKLGGKTVHPDFTLLNIIERKEIYWEHFGMMDDLEYRNNAFLKMREYENNGLYQFDSVIWTFETYKYPLNTKTIRGMVKTLREKLGY